MKDSFIFILIFCMSVIMWVHILLFYFWWMLDLIPDKKTVINADFIQFSLLNEDLEDFHKLLVKFSPYYYSY